jgi:hypothetical protein
VPVGPALAGRASLLALALLAGAARADDTDIVACQAAARTVNDPFPRSNLLQFQVTYRDIVAGGNATQVLVRLGVFYRGLLLPGLLIGDLYSFVRLEMYAESLNRLPSVSVVGLQDWNALWLGAKRFDWGVHVGAGVAAVLPTATDPALDPREFQLGPALAALVTHVPNLDAGVLVQFLFSVAGTTGDLAYVRVQPIVTYHLPMAFFLRTDPIWRFDFRHDPVATVPVNLHLGRALTARFTLDTVFEYVTTGEAEGDFLVRLNLGYVNW